MFAVLHFYAIFFNLIEIWDLFQTFWRHLHKDNLHFHHLYARAILRSILALYQHLVVVVVVCCARLASPGPGTTEDVKLLLVVALKKKRLWNICVNFRVCNRFDQNGDPEAVSWRRLTEFSLRNFRPMSGTARFWWSVRGASAANCWKIWSFRVGQ